MYGRSRSSTTEFAMLHRHVSTVAQNRQSNNGLFTFCHFLCPEVGRGRVFSQLQSTFLSHATKWYADSIIFAVTVIKHLFPLQ